jgi:hypothetical protein
MRAVSFRERREMSPHERAVAIKFRIVGKQGSDNRLYFRIARDGSAWATANKERQGALTEGRRNDAGDPFYREWLCCAGQGCRGRIIGAPLHR